MPIIIHTYLPSTSHFASNFPGNLCPSVPLHIFLFLSLPFFLLCPIAIAHLISLEKGSESNFVFVAFISGTAGIIMAAPSHYDLSMPIDIQYSRIEKKNLMRKEEL